MKDQQQKISQNSHSYTRKKSKRIDMFQTAPISRNLLQNTHQNQYIQQIKHVKKQQQRDIDAVKQKKQKPIRQSQKPTKIDINWSQKQNTTKNEGIIYQQKQQQTSLDTTNQKIGGFIFQNNSQSQQQGSKEQIKQQQKQKQQKNTKNDQKQKVLANPQSNKIIFEADDNSSQQQADSNKTNPSPTNKKPLQKIGTKTTIQIFGKLVQVQVQQQDQQDQQINQSGNKTQTNNNNNKILSLQQGEDKPKQLLKSTSILPFNTFAKLKLLRDKTYSNGVIFTVFLQSNNRFILSCKCISSQNYILSQNPLYHEQHNQYYVGKIKTSFFGNQVNLFTAGYNPEKARQMNKPIRQIVCTIVTHSQQIMEEVKPRDFTVYLLKPGLCYYKNLYGTKMYEEQIPLSKLYEDYLINRDKIIVFQNRKSKWNEKQKMHSLNMKGRAKMPSIKNYILENPSENGRQIMLFGKMGDNQFSFDLHHPLSPTIGMAIAISSFVHKSW